MNIFKTLFILCFTAYVGQTTLISDKNIGNQTLTSSNTSLDLKVKRKSVLVINTVAMRSKVKDDGTIHSLVYMDYDDAGKLLNEFWMRSLEDVSRFFEVFLDTRICHGKCDD